MEGDENKNKLYQSVKEVKMSKVRSVQEQIDTVATSLQDQVTTLGGISKDVKKLLTDHKGSHDVSPSEHDALGWGLMEVYVETSIGNKFSVNVKGTDTIRSMKAMIHDLKHFPQLQQTLYYRGKLLQDTDTLSGCNIFDNSTLHMILDEDISIRIKMPDGEYWMGIPVRKGYTIRDVMTIIKSRTGTPQQMQELEYDGRRLDDFDTLAQCGISGVYAHTFQLSISGQVIRPIEILVVSVMTDFRPKCYVVCSTENVINLKKKIGEEEGIYYEDVILTLSGRRLEDGIPPLSCRFSFPPGESLEDYRTFEDYEVESGSIIYLFG